MTDRKKGKTGKVTITSLETTKSLLQHVAELVN
jgi:hypothetical protein